MVTEEHGTTIINEYRKEFLCKTEKAKIYSIL